MATDTNCSQAVGVLIRVKDGDAWKFYPAAYFRGNPRKGVAMVPQRIPTTQDNDEAPSAPKGRKKLPPILKDQNGNTVYEDRKFEQFRYYLRLYQDGKMKPVPLDTTNPREIEEARALKAGKTLATNAAENAGGEFIDHNQTRPSTAVAVKNFLAQKQKDGVGRYWHHLYVLGLFQESMKKQKRVFMDEVLESDIKVFETDASKSRHVAGRVNSPRTTYSYMMDVQALFNHAKVPFPCGKLTMPKKLKSVYDREEQMAPFFEALEKESEEDYLIFGMNYFLGMREGEIRNAEDTDITFSAKTFRVQMKPHLGWKPKKGKERLIPIPTFFLEKLTKWVEAHPDRHLLFIPHRPSRFKDGRLRPAVRPLEPRIILQRLHRLVRRLGLECGHCENCLNPSPHRYCLSWKTHKFRATNITHKTQSGMDLETAAAQAGHDDIETTSDYTAAAVPTEVQDFMDNLDWFKNPYSRRQQTSSADPAASMLALLQYLESRGYTQEQISQIVSGAGKDLLPPSKPEGMALVKAS